MSGISIASIPSSIISSIKPTFIISYARTNLLESTECGWCAQDWIRQGRNHSSKKSTPTLGWNTARLLHVTKRLMKFWNIDKGIDLLHDLVQGKSTLVGDACCCIGLQVSLTTKHAGERQRLALESRENCAFFSSPPG
eukprot:2433830-Amphidinium_carterae.1